MSMTKVMDKIQNILLKFGKFSKIISNWIKLLIEAQLAQLHKNGPKPIN